MKSIQISNLNYIDPVLISADIYLLGNESSARTKMLLSLLGEVSEQSKLVYKDDNPSIFFERIIELTTKAQKEFKVFIDSSCLPRKVVANFFKLFSDYVTNDKKIIVFVGYILSQYSKPKSEYSPNKSFAPVHPYFAGWTTEPDSPVEIIVSLGYEESKATGAVEYLEPRSKWIFIPHSPEKQFLKEVKKQNQNLLKTETEHQIKYDVLEPIETYFKLNSLISSILPYSKLVILPFGPKIFFLLSLLVALQFRELAIWHVDTKEDDFGIGLDASGHSIFFSLELSLN